MSKHTLLFVERLNHCLDEIGMPTNPKERAQLFSKQLDIPKQLAWSLIEGQQQPDAGLLERLAAEFEVDPNWLLGK